MTEKKMKIIGKRNNFKLEISREDRKSNKKKRS